MGMFKSSRFVLCFIGILLIFILAVTGIILFGVGAYIEAAITWIAAIVIAFVTGKSSSKFAAKYFGGDKGDYQNDDENKPNDGIAL